MKLCWFLVFGVTMFHCGVCDNTGNDDQLFYVDIVAPGADQDIGVTMATINNTLFSAEGITVEEAFKLLTAGDGFGSDAIFSVLKFQALCDWRPLEAVLLAANLTMNVKSVYGEMNLAADLNINKHLLVWAPEPDIIRGDFLYLVDVRITMRGQTLSSYEEELRHLTEYCLKLRAIGIHYVNYNVLGELPIQMLFFLVRHPRGIEMGRWRYKDEMTEITQSVTRIERLDDYLSDNYCN